MSRFAAGLLRPTRFTLRIWTYSFAVIAYASVALDLPGALHCPSMTTPIAQTNLAARYENARYPRALLAAIVIILYAPSLFGGFMIDDLRSLRVMREFKEGRRDRPGTYEFLIGDESNAAERLAGNYPWWMGDNLKYRHFRPTAAYFLYGQYLL